MGVVVLLVDSAQACAVVGHEPPAFRPRDGRELQAALDSSLSKGANVPLRS